MSGTNLAKMPILIIALVVGIILATTAIVPLVSDYTDAKTFTNTGLYEMNYYSSTDSEEYTLEYVVSTNKLTVNGDVVDISNLGITNVSVITADTFFLRIIPNTRAFLMGSTSSSAATYFGFNADSVSVSMASGTLTATATTGESTSTATFTYTYAYAIESGGSYEYIMKAPNESVYVMADSVLFATGQTSINSSGDSVSSAIVMSGSIEDDVTFTAIKGATSTVFTNIQIVADPVDGYTDLYSLSKVTATATYDGTTTDITYSYFVVPNEVTADTDNPAAYKALVKVVPLMAFVALIAAAAFMIYSKRD